MRKINQLLILIVICVIVCSSFSYAEQSSVQEVSTKGIKIIELDVEEAEVVFDETSSKIRVPKELKLKRNADSLQIYAKEKTGVFDLFNDPKYKIIIGTARDYSMVEIDGGGLDITGKLKASHFEIDGGAISLDTHLIADSIEIDGGGIKWEGRVQAQTVEMDGAGANISLEIEKAKKIMIDGAGIFADIKYLDSWVGSRYLELDGAGSLVNILIPASNKEGKTGQLEVDKKGIVAVDVEYY